MGTTPWTCCPAGLGLEKTRDAAPGVGHKLKQLKNKISNWFARTSRTRQVLPVTAIPSCLLRYAKRKMRLSQNITEHHGSPFFHNTALNLQILQVDAGFDSNASTAWVCEVPRW